MCHICKRFGHSKDFCKRFRYSKDSTLVNLSNNFHFCKRFRHSKDSHWRIFWTCVTFAKDLDIQKIQLKFFPESFECFEYPANLTIFAKDSDIRKIQLWWIFEIIFTFAKDSDIRKIRIGESFEYLSHLQKIRTFKRFNSNFFPNLSNVLNILLTSLFLQKIQIFERFNSGESLK